MNTLRPPWDGAPINLIISAPDSREREELKKLIREKDQDARITADLPIIDAFAVEIGPDSLQVLPQLGKVAHDVHVVLDGQIGIPEPPEQPPSPPSTGLEVAAQTLGLNSLWERGITGKGVGIAILDTGVAPHGDLKDRIVGFHDVVNGRDQAYDDQGHGTHVSGIAAGDGTESHGRFVGAAPQANIIGVKVLDNSGFGSFSNVIAGIQWALENKDRYGIQVLNLSLGGRVQHSYKDDPVAQAVEAASRAGLVCCVAAGNNGPGPKTVTTPAHDPLALTVGAFDDRGTVDRSDDVIADFSGRGPTSIDGLAKPDVILPGVNITAADWHGGYRSRSGTSMASPMMAGIAALVRQARPDLSAPAVKEAIMKTADPMPALGEEAQGKGIPNAARAIQ